MVLEPARTESASAAVATPSRSAGQAVEMGDRADLGAEQEQIGDRDGVEIAAAPRLGEGDGGLRR